MKVETKKCGVCDISVFERNHYFQGKLMTARDFRDEQRYFNAKRWLINRTILGRGVVCGLDVCETEGKLVVEPGLAFDCCGHELLVCERQPVTIEKLRNAYRDDLWERGSQKLAVCLEYKECESTPRPIPIRTSACKEEELIEFDRIQDSFEIRIRPWLKELRAEEEWCPLTALKGKPIAVEEGECRTQTVHDYLCEGLKKPCPDCDEHPSVVLAVVTITDPAYSRQRRGTSAADRGEAANPVQQKEEKSGDAPQPVPQLDIDTCSHRKLIYGNPLLYKLISCYHGDLPHIVDFSWRRHCSDHYVDWETFVKLFEEGLTVTFDKVLLADTLNHHTFIVSATFVEVRTGYRIRRYIPGTVKCERRGDCFHATYQVNEDFKEDELRGKNSELARGVDIEVTLRGSLICDQEGKALDGNFIRGRLPSGNGVQGGDFVDWFEVRPRAKEARTAREKSS